LATARGGCVGYTRYPSRDNGYNYPSGYYAGYPRTYSTSYSYHPYYSPEYSSYNATYESRGGGGPFPRSRHRGGPACLSDSKISEGESHPTDKVLPDG
jgi:hypothetical protein